MALVGFHLSHGIWSALHTLGLGMDNEGVKNRMQNVALGVSIVVGAAFGLMPILVFLRPEHLLK
jgi:succinate dehydrogenase/fumarate reductase cytochrome b subunit